MKKFFKTKLGLSQHATKLLGAVKASSSELSHLFQQLYMYNSMKKDTIAAKFCERKMKKRYDINSSNSSLPLPKTYFPS